jgi:hypothetical protein
MRVRLTVLAVLAVIVWAAVIGVGSSIHPLKVSHLIAATVVALAAAVQRIGAVQNWLSGPVDGHRLRIEGYAQTTLINLCDSRLVSPELLDLRVHVWEVPLWYRRLFPFKLRRFLRGMRGRSRDSTAWTYRPALQRTAAIGLLKQAPTGVTFRKGVGLVGVCVANNDRAEYISLNVSDAEYEEALMAATEEIWRAHGPRVTHNLRLVDARKLSHSYGQVIGKVVQHIDSGEALGCVTLSVKTCDPEIFDLDHDAKVLQSLTALAANVAIELSS